MAGLVPVLLALVAVVAAAAASMPLIDGEFVSLHVGVPGTQLWFWVRTDVAYVTVLPTAELRTFSRSWTADGTDIVCAGTHCARMRIAIDADAPPPDPGLRLPVPARNYDGILGLGAGSPVFAVWPFWRISDRTLTLMTTNAPMPARHGRRVQQYPDAWVPARLGGTAAWARIDLAIDYTLVPWPLATARHRWPLDILNANGTRRVSRTMVAPWLFADTAADGSQLHAIRPIRTAPTAAAPAAAERQWTGNATVVLGRRMLQAGYVVQTDTLSGRMWLGCDWQAAPMMRTIDLMVLLLLLLPLDILWVYAIYDSVDFVRRIAMLTPPPPPPGQMWLRTAAADRAVPWGALHPPALPLPLTPTVGPVSVLSYRHGGFAAALTLATQLAWALVVLTIVLGFGNSNYYWHDTWDAYDAVAVYSTMGVSGVAAGALWLLPHYPAMVAGWGDSVVLLLMWLLAAGRPFVPAHSFIMLLTSAAVAASALKHAVLLPLGRLWPAPAYAAGWWLWLGVLVAAAAWSVWLFAFYTVRLVTLSWYIHTDAAWAMCSMALVVLFFMVHLVLRRQALVMVSLREAGRAHVDAASRQLAARLEKAPRSRPLL
jgi:hypothetical protein